MKKQKGGPFYEIPCKWARGRISGLGGVGTMPPHRADRTVTLQLPAARSSDLLCGERGDRM